MEISNLLQHKLQSSHKDERPLNFHLAYGTEHIHLITLTFAFRDFIFCRQDTALNGRATQCVSLSYREKHSYLENCLPAQYCGLCRCRSYDVFFCLHSTLLAASGICARYVTTFRDVSSQIVCLHNTWNCLDLFFFIIFLTLAGTVSWEQTVGVGQVEAAQRSQLQQNMLTYTWDAVHSVLPASHVC